MLTLGAFAFAAPWVLAALAGLPILWWLLRVTPPSPKLVRFPAIRLLLRLQEKEDTPARTPWWLLLLRILIVLLLVVGLAHPLMNPEKGFEQDGPLVIAIDNGWSAAPNWQTRQNRVSELLDTAAREDRKVILLATARRTPGEPIAASGLMRAEDARAKIQALSPQAWPSDHMAAAPALDELAKRVTNGNVVWLSDGLMHRETETFAVALKKVGRVVAVTDEAGKLPVLLHPARLAGGGIVFAMERAEAGRPARYELSLSDENGRAIGRRTVTFKEREKKVDVALSLPSELRNRLARISVDRHRSAGATLLLDERLRRRPVGVISAARLNDNQPLMSDLYYIERALSPFSEIRKGPVDQLLQRPLSVIVLPDRAPLTRQERTRLARWIAEGGLLVRFAGPVLARNPDALLPVRLRGGNRSFGGAMTWSQPLALAPFDAESPFAGLTIPGDATVKRQVLAEPGIELERKTWARLQDGTPLVTADRRGKGLLVLFHTMANPDWSSLPLSGLFVEMLQRTVALGRGVTESDAQRTTLAPYRILDGFGRLVEAPEWVRPIETARLEQTVVGPANPPGLYGPTANRRSLNLSATVRRLVPLGALPAGIAKLGYRKAEEIDLRPWLLMAALILFLLDLSISFFLRGLVPRRAAATAAILCLLALPAGFPSAAVTGPGPGRRPGRGRNSRDPGNRLRLCQDRRPRGRSYQPPRPDRARQHFGVADLCGARAAARRGYRCRYARLLFPALLACDCGTVCAGKARQNEGAGLPPERRHDRFRYPDAGRFSERHPEKPDCRRECAEPPAGAGRPRPDAILLPAAALSGSADRGGDLGRAGRADSQGRRLARRHRRQ